MGAKKFDKDEYNKISNENQQMFEKLDKQILEERRAEGKKFSNMTEEEKKAYLYEKDAFLNKEAEGKFKNTISLQNKKVDL